MIMPLRKGWQIYRFVSIYFESPSKTFGFYATLNCESTWRGISQRDDEGFDRRDKGSNRQDYDSNWEDDGAIWEDGDSECKDGDSGYRDYEFNRKVYDADF